MLFRIPDLGTCSIHCSWGIIVNGPPNGAERYTVNIHRHTYTHLCVYLSLHIENLSHQFHLVLTSTFLPFSIWNSLFQQWVTYSPKLCYHHQPHGLCLLWCPRTWMPSAPCLGLLGATPLGYSNAWIPSWHHLGTGPPSPLVWTPFSYPSGFHILLWATPATLLSSPLQLWSLTFFVTT